MEIDHNNYNWPKIGNEKAISFLSKVLDGGNPASSYIFVGPEDLGKSTIAMSFARNLQGSLDGYNSDLHILARSPEEKSIPIESVREFIKMLSLGSFLGSYKIGLIKEAIYLSEEAKSALLKTLEEPKDKVVIITLVDDLSHLPATIISRSQVVYFQPVASDLIYDYLIENYKTNRSLAKDLANICLGRPLKAINFVENPKKYKEYTERAETCLNMLTAESGAARIEILELLFKDKTWSKEARKGAKDLIFLAEGLVRDIMLLSLGQPNLMQHLVLADKLTAAKENFGNDNQAVLKALNYLKVLAQAKDYLNASVNPRLVLEQVILNY